MSRIMKALIGTAVLAIAACLLFIVGGPRPADPEGLRGRVRDFVGMRDNRRPPCHDILIQISLSKFDWAAENGKTTNDTPTWNDLGPYFSLTFTNNATTAFESLFTEIDGGFGVDRGGGNPTITLRCEAA